MSFVAWLHQGFVERFFHGRFVTMRLTSGPAEGVVFPLLLPQDQRIVGDNYERRFSRAIATECTKGCIGFDVGGWHGYYAAIMAARGCSKVHVFEPLFSNCRQIRKLQDLNPGLEIELHRIALSDNVGKAVFSVGSDTSMGSLESVRTCEDRARRREISVNVETLDSMVFVHALDPPNVIKIDAEGAELQILRGAERVLREIRPVLYIEIHSSELLTACTELLEQLGYGIEVVVPPELIGHGEVVQIVARSV